MALKLHIHSRGRVRTVDLSPPTLREQYEDLMERLLAALSRQGVTHDDAPPGHPFYGNQYTDVVLGPKPTATKTKGVKNQVHELLSSGHPFDFEELKTMTGAKLNQQLHNAINELKAGKHAAGKLHIEKIGGKYQVVKADGTPAAGIAPEPAKAADPPPSPTQAEKTAPSPVPEAPSAPPSAVAAANEHGISIPSTPLSKADADKLYQADLSNALKQAAANFDNFDPEDDHDGTLAQAFEKEQALAWKQAKAKAMAQWATNTTGTLHVPKPVEVFQADIWAVKAAHLGILSDEEILAEWKKNTAEAKAKAALAPPKVEPPKPAEPVSPVLAATPTGPSVFKAPDKLVPDDHQHISADDFATGQKYVKGIADLHDKLHKSASTSAAANKKHIQEALGKRLKASPHFQAMEAQYAKKNSATYGGSLSARLISAWAGSSGDHQPISVSAQLAIRDAFNMNPEHVETKAFHYLDSHSEDQTHKDAAAALNIDVSTPEKLASYKEGMKDFALAQYHETQEHLKKLGVKELYLVRGMKIGSSSGEAKHTKVKLQPASSFTTAHSTAKSFAGGHSLFAVKVPASQVIGSFCTGYGCTNESEVVVLNHENMHAFQVGVSNASSATSMASHIKQKAGGSSAPAASTPTTSTTPANTKVKPPTSIPAIAFKAKGHWAAAAATEAKAGNLSALLAVQQSLEGQVGYGASKAYVKGLVDLLQKQPKIGASAQAAVSLATPNKNPPQKNAYYYKKLKEKVLSHPLHSESTYKGLKDIGHTNEKVLEYYEQMHEKTYGKKYHA